MPVLVALSSHQFNTESSPNDSPQSPALTRRPSATYPAIQEPEIVGGSGFDWLAGLVDVPVVLEVDTFLDRDVRLAFRVGLLLPATRVAAAVCLLVLMLAMFPANIYAVRMPDPPAAMTTRLPVRTAEEILYLAAAVAVAFAG